MTGEDFKPLFKLKQFKAKGDDEILAVSYHEAGHALIDLIYGFKPYELMLIPPEQVEDNDVDISETNEGELSVFFYSLKAFEISREFGKEYKKVKNQHFISLMLGGIVAGAMYSAEHDFEGSESDLNLTIKHFNSIGVFNLDNQLYQPYYDNTVILLETYQHLLTKIANDLYEKRLLTEDYFQNIQL